MVSTGTMTQTILTSVMRREGQFMRWFCPPAQCQVGPPSPRPSPPGEGGRHGASRKPRCSTRFGRAFPFCSGCYVNTLAVRFDKNRTTILRLPGREGRGALPLNWALPRAHIFSLSPRGTSGERVGERGIPGKKALLSPALSCLGGKRGRRSNRQVRCYRLIQRRWGRAEGERLIQYSTYPDQT